jgi:regulator of protease activity HflC (stomatin/prohibitin superfamily)
MNPLIAGIVVIVVFLASAINILKEYERGVIFRLGRLVGQRGPGVVIVIPGIEKMVRMDLRTVTMDVPPQDVITKDNVPVKVNAVAYFHVVKAADAVVNVEDYYSATLLIAQTTLRSVVGQIELDDLLSDREKINRELQKVIDEHTDPWGIKVSIVEVKDVELPQEMRRAIAKQAEAERERRAKIIHAEGELQASDKLAQAAKKLSANPESMQLRFLQTLTEVAAEKNSTTIFPVPIDFFSAVMKKLNK